MAQGAYYKVVAEEFNISASTVNNIYRCYRQEHGITVASGGKPAITKKRSSDAGSSAGTPSKKTCMADKDAMKSDKAEVKANQPLKPSHLYPHTNSSVVVKVSKMVLVRIPHVTRASLKFSRNLITTGLKGFFTWKNAIINPT